MICRTLFLKINTSKKTENEKIFFLSPQNYVSRVAVVVVVVTVLMDWKLLILFAAL